MEIKTQTQDITDFKGDLIIVGIFRDAKSLTGATLAVDQALDGAISKVIADGEIRGKLGETTLLHDCRNLKSAKVLVVGLGKKEKADYDSARKAAATAALRARATKAKSVGTALHAAGSEGLETRQLAQALTEGTVLSLYRFNQYKKPDDEHEIRIFSIIEKDKGKIRNIKEGIAIGKILAESQNTSRDLINEPANNLTPEKLLGRVKKMIRSHHLQETIKCQCLDATTLKRMGMGALLAVAQGSTHEAKFISLRVKRSNKPLTCLIGKTVTFDSGGISIKPSSGMGSMKGDMAGGAVAIGTTLALARAASRINLMTLIPAVENMPSGSAYRPGDVVRALNGKTIEIITTDAEGRLTLADAIGYAENKGARVIVDIATLTGGCVVALGNAIAAVMGNDQPLVDRLLKISKDTGEPFWQLPLHDEYRQLIKSDVADLKNSGGRSASTITAGLFLQAFVDRAKWLHIDVAGNELTDKSNYYTPVGGTGFGVRTLFEFLRDI